MRKLVEKYQDPLFYPAPVQAVRPLRAAGVHGSGRSSREASTDVELEGGKAFLVSCVTQALHSSGHVP